LGKSYQVEATDQSLRLNRPISKEPAMRAGVMCHDVEIPHSSERVVGQHSNTWVELAAVVMKLQGTSRADNLAIIINSAAGIQRLRFLRKNVFMITSNRSPRFLVLFLRGGGAISSNESSGATRRMDMPTIHH